MPTVKSIKEEPQLSVEEDYSVGTDAECQTEDWDEDRMKKYRNMKRKLIELVARKSEYRATIDKLNRRVQFLEKKTRNQQQQKSSTTSSKNNDESAMDIDELEEGEDKEATADSHDIEGEEEENEEDQLDEDDDDAPEPKKQRLTRRKRVSIPRDADGNIVLPFQIASLNIVSLGKIDYERPHFHNERYIFPIGYTIERVFYSMVDPNNQTAYRCKVEDGQDGPLFTINAADAPEIELSAKTATGVWALVIKKANEVRQKESSNAISGPEYYGFAHPIVIEMMEEMEDVDKCARYKRKLSIK